MDDQAPKVTRARMIIEMSDGRAVYWDARDPQKAEFESLAAESLTWDDLLNGAEPLPPQPRAALRITGGIPWLVQSYRDSGEIPPDLADRMVTFIDNVMRSYPPDGTPAQLRPYLARIAGRQA